MPKKSPAPGPAPAALGRSTKELAQDDLVMSTNSSSIVSKRSVERIYYPDEPHFFRFFVKKFQRRSPLVNRGYHFRLHIIDVSVRNFLQRPSGKKKVIVNLGAGSDVLPWQCMTRYPEACHGAKFVDIDFPDLIAKKRRIVQETPELHSVLTDLEYGNGQSDLQLTSNEYVQIGCDLRQLDRLQDALSQVVDIPECEFIFIAEVSITYMETEAADSVIQWASTLGHAEFCLLEQILPDGPDHPFADMMVRHFHKMRAPIKSVNQYPTLQAQQARFQRLGWVHADAQSLWGAWSSERYLTPAERRKMDRIEPFDEWEEFAIFVSHYCIDAEMDVLSAGPSSRMCHSMVDLGVHGQLLAGGRASPSSAFRDCWRFDGTTRLWQKAADLPQPLFRHSAARLGRSSLALVVGGKTDSTSVFKSCLLYQPDAGWTECNVSGTDYVPVFGAVLVSYPDPISPESEDGEPTVGFHGLLIGGVLEDGTLAEQALYWRLSIRGADKPELRFEAVSTVDDSGRAQPNAKWPDESTLYRFGASAVMGDDGNLLVIGGIIKDRVIPRDEELLLLSAKNSKIRISATAPIIQPGATSSQTDIPRPALLGISVSTTATGDIVVMSGGATCYSFGTYWNSGTYSLRYNLPGAPNPPQNQAPVPWRFQKSVEFTEAAADLENAAVQVSPPDE
ncbi:leucine carboxyl methyltransferase 2 [Apiospora saccharicola]